jgi:hypothetical protein
MSAGSVSAKPLAAAALTISTICALLVHQLSIRLFRDLSSESLNVELLKADGHWSLATGDFQR